MTYQNMVGCWFLTRCYCHGVGLELIFTEEEEYGAGLVALSSGWFCVRIFLMHVAFITVLLPIFGFEGLLIVMFSIATITEAVLFDRSFVMECYTQVDCSGKELGRRRLNFENKFCFSHIINCAILCVDDVLF
jgi:hypothetical protein